MRTELTHTLQEKLQLEIAVKTLQLRINKLEVQLGDPSNATAELIAWSPLCINVKENIQNYENRTRAVRSGSVDTGVYVFILSTLFVSILSLSIFLYRRMVI
jgi:hypothetical protein